MILEFHKNECQHLDYFYIFNDITKEFVDEEGECLQHLKNTNQFFIHPTIVEEGLEYNLNFCKLTLLRAFIDEKLTSTLFFRYFITDVDDITYYITQDGKNFKKYKKIYDSTSFTHPSDNWTIRFKEIK